MKSSREDSRPGFFFFVNDYLAAGDLATCSLAAQGLWMRLLCYAFASPKKGYLLLSSGTKMDSKMIAKLCGETEDNISKYLAELKVSGTSEEDQDGIYCRRMARKQGLSLARSIAGKAGLQKRWHSKQIAKGDSKAIANTSTSTKISTSIDIFNDKGKEDIKQKEEIQIIEYLNLKSGKHFRNTQTNIEKVRHRLKEGFTLENCKTVIDIKTKEWNADPNMEKFVRPSTLFGTKFEEYLNQKGTAKPASNLPSSDEPYY